MLVFLLLQLHFPPTSLSSFLTESGLRPLRLCRASSKDLLFGGPKVPTLEFMYLPPDAGKRGRCSLGPEMAQPQSRKT